MDGQSITAVSEMDDDVIALLALDARSKGLTPSGLTFPKWSNYMRTDELMGEHWLLSYEANLTGWLPSISVPDHVSRGANFRFLKTMASLSTMNWLEPPLFQQFQHRPCLQANLKALADDVPIRIANTDDSYQQPLPIHLCKKIYDMIIELVVF